MFWQELLPLLGGIVGAIVFSAMLLRLACTISRVTAPSLGNACLIATITLSIFLLIATILGGFNFAGSYRSRYYTSELVQLALTLGFGTPIIAWYYRDAIPVPRYSLAIIVAAVNLILYLGLGALLWGAVEASHYLNR